MGSIDDLHDEIEAALVAASPHGSDQKSSEFYRSMHKTRGYRAYFLKADQLHRVIRDFRPRFDDLPPKQRLSLAEKLFRSGFIEKAGVGVGILMRSLDYLDPGRFQYLDRLADHLNNWGTTDWFSLDVMQPLLMRRPDEIVALLRKWNASDHMWKQRSSVVSFARKAGASGKYTDIVLELCENLVNSDEGLIRKAIGWALKDNLRGNRKKVLSYVKDLRERGVSSVVTLYAVRDVKGDERRDILRIKPPRRK